MGFTRQWLDITKLVVQAVGKRAAFDQTADGYRTLRWTFDTIEEANAAARCLEAAGVVDARVSVTPA